MSAILLAAKAERLPWLQETKFTIISETWMTSAPFFVMSAINRITKYESTADIGDGAYDGRDMIER